MASNSWGFVHAFLGDPVAKSSVHAFAHYSVTYRDLCHAYITSYSDPQTSSIPAFLNAVVVSTSAQDAYVSGGNITASSRKAAFIGTSVVRSHLSVRFGGDGTGAIVAERAYLELETSDASVKKRFRVVAQNYDDGMLVKAEKLDRTIGGGIDHSVGANYQEWNPIIKVRHTEEDTSYGTVDDLRYFYTLNNPNGTPSNNITLYDHHNMNYTVHLVGPFKKQLLGAMTEGIYAWSIISLKMVEV